MRQRAWITALLFAAITPASALAERSVGAPCDLHICFRRALDEGAAGPFARDLETESTAAQEASRRENGNVFLSVALGAGLGVAGAMVGGALGAGIETHDESWADATAILTCGLVGETLAMPLGAHLGNGARGSYWWDLLAGVGGAGIGIAAAAIPNEGAVLLSVPVLQLVACVVTERCTGANGE